MGQGLPVAVADDCGGTLWQLEGPVCHRNGHGCGSLPLGERKTKPHNALGNRTL
jgi:hypothetical protein